LFYRSIHSGSFAGSWSDLKTTLKTGQIPYVSVLGDPDDPNFEGEITYDTTFIPAIDSVKALGWNVDSLQYIPYGGGKSFDIKADTLSYQKTLVNVVEVGTTRKNYMGKYAFGDMSKPNLSGNWER